MRKKKPGRYGRIVGDRCLRQRPGLVHFNGLAAWPTLQFVGKSGDLSMGPLMAW